MKAAPHRCKRCDAMTRRKVWFPVSNPILTRGDVVNVFVYSRWKSRAECSCGWDGRRRLTRAGAVVDAHMHATRGCQPDQPLVVDERAHGASWFQKLTPWPVLAWSPLLLIGAVWLAPDAGASTDSAALISVTVAWEGETCLHMIAPDPDTDRTTTSMQYSCDPAQVAQESYVAVTGDWVGVDPVDERGVATACIVRANGDIIMQASGLDGVDCLGQW